MKFEDMKKIWNDQEQQHFYAIDEKQLHETIKAKKKGASRLLNRIELLLIVVNFISGITLVVLNGVNGRNGERLFGYLLGGFMLLIATYIVVRRWQRLKDENRFDRTMLGDLEHAIANASYQANLSYVMLLSIIPIFVISFLGAYYENKSTTTLIGIVLFFALAFFLGRWEHRSWHIARKRRLESMRDKLVNG